MPSNCITAGRRPNLFIVGAMKSGTSSLHRYLGDHPEIFMCEPKEPSYFVARHQLNWPEMERMGFWRGEEHYLRLFESAGDVKYCGESSTLYTKAPQISGVPERIRDFCPDARIIYVIRDPVERTISHYWHMVRHHGEARPLLHALREDPHYCEVSDYAMQLEPYLSCFGRERCCVILFEELVSTPTTVVRHLFEWLGVDPQYVPATLGLRENATPEVVERVRGGGWLNRFRYSGVWNRVGSWVPSPVRAAGRRMALATVNRRETNALESVEFLRTVQRAQVERLGRMLNRSFPNWSTLHGELANESGPRATCPSNT